MEARTFRSHPAMTAHLPAAAMAQWDRSHDALVLIVEDETKTADYLHKGLTEHSCVVDVARNGLDGRHLAIENDYDAIVLDVMLPGVDGFGVLEALRQRRQG